MAHSSVHGRYFAGKQVKCEFVSLTRWKVAICGEYMKSRLKTCSRGSACNFLHCFSNPGGDYEWADCDKPPPRYWAKKMTALFGYSDDSCHDQQIEQPSPKDQQHSSKIFTSDRDSYHYKRRQSIETNQYDGGSGRSRHEEDHARKSRHHEQKKDNKSYEDETEYKNNHYGSSENRSRHNRIDYYDRSRSRTHGSSSDEDLYTERRHAYKKRRSRHHENILESSSETELQKHKESKTDSGRYHRRHDDEVGHRESENEPFIKKEKKRYRKSASLHRNNRSRSRDSGYLSDRSDRWDPEGSPNEDGKHKVDYDISDDGKTKYRSGSLEEESKNQEKRDRDHRMREKRKRI